MKALDVKQRVAAVAASATLAFTSLVGIFPENERVKVSADEPSGTVGSNVDDTTLVFGNQEQFKGKTLDEAKVYARNNYLLGTASQFNLFVRDNITVHAADCEGRVAVGGVENNNGITFDANPIGYYYETGAGHKVMLMYYEHGVAELQKDDEGKPKQENGKYVINYSTGTGEPGSQGRRIIDLTDIWDELCANDSTLPKIDKEMTFDRSAQARTYMNNYILPKVRQKLQLPERDSVVLDSIPNITVDGNKKYKLPKIILGCSHNQRKWPAVSLKASENGTHDLISQLGGATVIVGEGRIRNIKPGGDRKIILQTDEGIENSDLEHFEYIFDYDHHPNPEDGKYYTRKGSSYSNVIKSTPDKNYKIQKNGDGDKPAVADVPNEVALLHTYKGSGIADENNGLTRGDLIDFEEEFEFLENRSKQIAEEGKNTYPTYIKKTDKNNGQVTKMIWYGENGTRSDFTINDKTYLAVRCTDDDYSIVDNKIKKGDTELNSTTHEYYGEEYTVYQDGDRYFIIDNEGDDHKLYELKEDGTFPYVFRDYDSYDVAYEAKNFDKAKGFNPDTDPVYINITKKLVNAFKTDNQYTDGANLNRMIGSKIRFTVPKRKTSLTGYQVEGAGNSVMYQGEPTNGTAEFWGWNSNVQVSVKTELEYKINDETGEYAWFYKKITNQGSDTTDYTQFEGKQVGNTGIADANSLINDGNALSGMSSVVYYTAEGIKVNEDGIAVSDNGDPAVTAPEIDEKNWWYADIIVNVEGIYAPDDASNRIFNQTWVRGTDGSGYTSLTPDFKDTYSGSYNNKFGSNRILYNFPDATEVCLSGNFQGSILAPMAKITDKIKYGLQMNQNDFVRFDNADYDVYRDEIVKRKDQTPGHLSGALICKSIDSTMEFGYRPCEMPPSRSTETIDDYDYRADFEISKTDKDGKALSGAEFTLTNTKTNQAITITSDKNGKLRFENIPEGEYELKETKAPNGYIKSEETHIIQVKKDKNTAVVGKNNVSYIKDLSVTVDNEVKATANPANIFNSQFIVDGYLVTFAKNGEDITPTFANMPTAADDNSNAEDTTSSSATTSSETTTTTTVTQPEPTTTTEEATPPETTTTTAEQVPSPEITTTGDTPTEPAQANNADEPKPVDTLTAENKASPKAAEPESTADEPESTDLEKTTTSEAPTEEANTSSETKDEPVDTAAAALQKAAPRAAEAPEPTVSAIETTVEKTETDGNGIITQTIMANGKKYTATYYPLGENRYAVSFKIGETQLKTTAYLNASNVLTLTNEKETGSSEPDSSTKPDSSSSSSSTESSSVTESSSTAESSSVLESSSEVESSSELDSSSAADSSSEIESFPDVESSSVEDSSSEIIVEPTPSEPSDDSSSSAPDNSSVLEENSTVDSSSKTQSSSTPITQVEGANSTPQTNNGSSQSDTENPKTGTAASGFAATALLLAAVVVTSKKSRK